MPARVYLWHLAIILPTWAVLLPLFRVYSEPTLPPLTQIGRLSKAIGLAGLVMAAAGLKRLGLSERIAEYLPPEVCLPAPAQGALALQARDGDHAINIVAFLRDAELPVQSAGSCARIRP